MARAPRNRSSGSANEFIGRPYQYAQGRVAWVRAFLRNLNLASYLSFVAGFVNSVAFMAFGGFVANITGTSTRTAVEYSAGRFDVAASLLLLMALFIGGAIVTTLCLSGQSVENHTKRFGAPLLMELVLIAGVAFYGTDGVGSLSLYALTFAMGLQNALIRQASGTIVRTTHMTGTATDIGVAIGTAFISFAAEVRHGWRRTVARISNEAEPLAARSLHPLRFAADVLRSFVAVFRFERFLLHFSILLSFLAGALLGAWGYGRVGSGILYCPAGVLAFIIVRELQPRKKKREAVTHGQGAQVS